MEPSDVVRLQEREIPSDALHDRHTEQDRGIEGLDQHFLPHDVSPHPDPLVAGDEE